MQVNYLVDEATSCGKGANSIVSMIHRYLCNFTRERKISVSMQITAWGRIKIIES